MGKNQQEVIKEFTTKGSLVTLTGKWKRNKGKDKNGNTTYFDYLLVESIDLLEDKSKTDERKAKNEAINNPFGNSEKNRYITCLLKTIDDINNS